MMKPQRHFSDKDAYDSTSDPAYDEGLSDDDYYEG